MKLYYIICIFNLIVIKQSFDAHSMAIRWSLIVSIKALGDTIFRVGCDLKRKLGPEDRMAGAIRNAMEYDLPYDRILFVLVCSCHFRAENEDGIMLKEDVEFVNRYQNDIYSILKEVCGFNENSHIFQDAADIDNVFKHSDF